MSQINKIDFGKLVVDEYTTEEIISWLHSSSKQQLVTILDAINSENIGLIGSSVSQLSIVVGVIQALDEKVNGKKEPTVV